MPKCREQHVPRPPIEAIRWRSEATKTKRSAGGKRFAIRWRFAPILFIALRILGLLGLFLLATSDGIVS